MIAVLEKNGSQSLVMNIYRAIDRSQVQFDFIVDHPDRCVEMKQEIESLGGRVYHFPTFKGINIVRVRRAWDRFFTEHPEYRILHTHSRSYASLYLPIAKRHGLVTISHAHSTSNGTGLLAFIKTTLQFPLRYQADYMFACSRKAGEWQFGRKATRSERYRIIPNMIDAQRFAFDPAKRERVRDELGLRDAFVIGHVGRMSPVKNHAFMLRVFKEARRRNERARLLLVGDGELFDETRAEAARLGLGDDVIFLGARKNVEDYYQAMDLFLFPSLWEGLPLVIVEAQAAGLHVVMSDTVSKEADMGLGLIRCLALSASAGAWADEAEKAYPRCDSLEAVRKKGFDIGTAAQALQDFYSSL